MWTDRTKKSIYSLKALMIIAVINRFGPSSCTIVKYPKEDHFVINDDALVVLFHQKLNYRQAIKYLFLQVLTWVISIRLMWVSFSLGPI